MRNTHVRNVDSSRNSTTSKSKNLKTGKVRRKELVLLKLSTPRQLRNLSRRGFNQLAESLGPLLVDTGSETFPLTPDTVRVTVSLDETDVALDRRAQVHDPVALRVLVGFHRAVVERLHIFCLHGFFLGVACEFLRFREVACDLGHLGGMVAKDEAKLLALQRSGERPLGLLDVAGRRISNSRCYQNLEIARRSLAHARVLREKTLSLDEVGGVRDFLGRDVGRVGVVCGHVSLVRVAQVHACDAGLVQVVLESVVQLLGSRAGFGEFGKAFLGDAWDDLAVAEGAVVARVADELGGVAKKVLEVGV
jgi:hypothetical protein